MFVVDSHTAGEPTRLVVEGGPDLGSGPLAERRKRFGETFDHVRNFVLNEPRGFDAIVGALLCGSVDPSCAAGLIFFNNAGTLGMCGHGTIGAAVTLAHLGRIGLGRHRFETPVGIVEVELKTRNEAAIDNVPAYVHARDVSVETEEFGRFVGDVAWGGNWFYIVHGSPFALEPRNIPKLTRAAIAAKTALAKAGHVGADAGEVDHVEFCAPSPLPDANGRNFVLCPGGAYDRSPCGTGTSAKLACLAAAGEWPPERVWVQESVIGSRFWASYSPGEGGRIHPRITGRAYVTAETRFLRDAEDPFPNGIAF